MKSNQRPVRYSALRRILSEVYGVTEMEASPTTIVWAFERLRAIVGRPEALVQVKSLNAHRSRFGKIPAFIE